MVARNPRTGYVLVLVAAAMFGLNGSVSKVVLDTGIAPTQLTAIRVTGAFLGLLVLTLLAGPSRLRVSWRQLPMLATYGIVGVALIQWFYFVAIDRLPVGLAVLLEFTGPVLVALYARVVLGEPVRRRIWLAIALSLGGLALVAQVWRGGDLDALGLLAGAGAAFALAAYYLMGEHGVRSRDPLSLTCWSFLFGAAFWLVLQPTALVSIPNARDAVSLTGALDQVTAPTWLLLAWIVVLGTLIPFLLSLYALRHLSATQAGVTATAEPLLAAIVGWMWLGQTLSSAQLVGGALVLGGIALAQSARDQHVAVPTRSEVAAQTPASPGSSPAAA
jgi:drug/metabolite transporter (DMT)-like permease